MDVTIATLIIILVLCFVLSLLVTKETFYLPELVFQVNLNMNNLIINAEYSDVNIPGMKQQTSTVRNITFSQNLEESHVVLTDVYSVLTNKQSIPLAVTIVPDVKVLLFVKTRKAGEDLTLSNYLLSSKQILYTSKNALEIGKAIIQCSNINIDNVVFKYADRFDPQSSYLYIMFDHITNLKFNANDRVDVISYEECDINKIKVLIPYGYFKNIDMRTYFQSNLDTEFSVRRCLAIDYVIVQNLKKVTNHNLDKFSYQIRSMLVNGQNYDVVNYYTRYIDFIPITIDFIRKSNKHLQERGIMPILEQFSADEVLLAPKTNIEGFFDSASQILIVSSLYIEKVPGIVGMSIHLQNQSRQEENGRYKVERVLTRELVLKKTSSTNTPHTDPRYDAQYVCYGDPYIKSAALCNSKRNEVNEPKQYETKWDKPCTTNDECPFYQANKNYKNYRGGCVDGYCEFPLGIRRISFREYDRSSEPVCHGCNKNTILCCNEQKDKTLYPHLRSPDYVFELDEYERGILKKSR